MSIDRLFLAFMAVCGAAAGGILAAAPESRNFVVVPYFWILIAMAAFEGIAFWRGRGATSTAVSMEMRLLGFVVAVVLIIVVPIFAGSPGRLF